MCLGEKNVGDVDRVARLVVAIVLLYAIATGIVAAPLSYVAGIVMLALFFTVASGTCALYSIMGISTCPVADKASPAGKTAKRTRKEEKQE